MRLAWFTPYGTRSDIGAHSRCIVEALADNSDDGAQSTVCLFVNKNGDTYPTKLPVVTLSPHFDSSILKVFDFNIYNIGNNQDNHLYINEIALKLPGVVVVHDMVMQHYIAWKIFEDLKRPDRYAELLVKHYGGSVLDVLERSRITMRSAGARYAPWDSDYCFSFPLLEPFLKNAQAVIVHSQFAADAVRQVSGKPLLQLFLPFDKKPVPDLAAPATGSQKVVFTVVGHIGRAKYIHLCIQALKQSSFLRERARIKVVGMPGDREYVAELQSYVKSFGLEDVVDFEFSVSEDRLVEIKAETDVFLNLRFPNTESASGSLTEQLACRKAAIVYDSGCYREIPDDCVVKITSLESPAELEARMVELVQNSAFRSSVGARGFDYISKRSASRYGEELIDFLTQELVTGSGKRRSSSHMNSLSLTEFAHELDNATAIDKIGAPWFATKYSGMSLAGWQQLSRVDAARFLGVGVMRESIPKGVLRTIGSILSPLGRDSFLAVGQKIAFYVDALQQGRALYPTDLNEATDGFALSIILLVSDISFAELCYRLILGRGPYSGEANKVAERLRNGELAAKILKEFADSEEFRSRNTRSEFRERLLSCGKQIDQLLLAKRESAVVLNQFMALDQNADTEEILAGEWYSPEDDGVWSRGRVGSLTFRLPDGLSGTETLILCARVTGTSYTGQRRISWSINGEVVSQLEVADDEQFQLSVPVSMITELPFVFMSLEADSSVRLSEHEPMGDSRDLGIFLYWIGLAGDTMTR